MDQLIRRAAEAIASADAILIGAGAGMGVDSGLPDYRGSEGFWKAYPPFKKLGLSFAALADPQWFYRDPSLAWGFYGHRMHLYRDTVPHAGFALLKAWANRTRLGAWAYTSNVDGQFQKVGFDRVLEIHGSIHRMQCLRRCGQRVFSADSFNVTVDPETMRAEGDFPSCPRCRVLARPNILMFGDGGWDLGPVSNSRAEYYCWLEALEGSRVVTIECGAGTAIPSVRAACLNVARLFNGTLIRINPREAEVPDGHIGLPMGSLAALEAISRHQV